MTSTEFKGIGLDANGYVRTLGSAHATQAAFVPLVETAKRCILRDYGDNLHSVYLYGSVARGEAVEGRSDLDMIVVLASDPGKSDVLQNLKTHLYKSADHLVTKVDLDLVTVEEVMDPKSLYGWGFWLKHCSRNILGSDLAAEITSFRPDIQIARGVNGDVLEVARDYAKRITMADNKLKTTLFREIAKKVIRALASSVAHKEPCWIADVEPCKDLAIAHYPNATQQLNELYLASQIEGTPSKSHLDLVLALAAHAHNALEA